MAAVELVAGEAIIRACRRVDVRKMGVGLQRRLDGEAAVGPPRLNEQRPWGDAAVNIGHVGHGIDAGEKLGTAEVAGVEGVGAERGEVAV